MAFDEATVATHAAKHPVEKLNVVFIGGYCRSGSTLLDRMLGCIPGFFSAGELRYLWDWGLKKNLLCACVSPTKDCAFRSKVLHAALGPVDQTDVDRVLWKSKLGMAKKLTVVACSWPMLTRYGYPLWA